MASNPVSILAVAKPSPLLAPQLEKAFTVYDRSHELQPSEFAAIAPTIRAIVGGGESRVTAGLIEQLPALELIAIMGVGYDGIDVSTAKEKGIVVTHTPNVLNDDVADLAFGLMLCAARKIPTSDSYIREGLWPTLGPLPLTKKVSGANLGIVGMGRIAREIAIRAEAFKMKIAYTARSKKDNVPWRYIESLTGLAAESDFLVVITPGGHETRNLIGAEVMKALGPKGFLINVARGSVVDEAALIDSLESGILGGAALDVFENEPAVPDRLRALKNVVLTPHIGSATTVTRQAMADLTFANLREYFAGRSVLTPVPECQVMPRA